MVKWNNYTVFLLKWYYTGTREDDLSFKVANESKVFQNERTPNEFPLAISHLLSIGSSIFLCLHRITRGICSATEIFIYLTFHTQICSLRLYLILVLIHPPKYEGLVKYHLQHGFIFQSLRAKLCLLMISFGVGLIITEQEITPLSLFFILVQDGLYHSHQ